MKIKTSELTGAALDWAVAKCEDCDTRNNCVVEFFVGSEWKEGVPIEEFPCMADSLAHAKEQMLNAYVGAKVVVAYFLEPYHPSTEWAKGGPIIERAGIVVTVSKEHGWLAAHELWHLQDLADRDLCSAGPTYLIAAMRCLVASELGDEVEIPEELAKD